MTDGGVDGGGAPSLPSSCNTGLKHREQSACLGPLLHVPQLFLPRDSARDKKHVVVNSCQGKKLEHLVLGRCSKE